MRLHDRLDNQAREHPDAPFAIQGERSITYGEALAETNRLAHALIDSGLAIGDRIAVLAKNSIEYALLYFAASKAGVVPVPLNYRLAPTEWTYIVSDAGAKVLLADEEFVDGVDGIHAELPTVERFVTFGARQGVWEDYHGWVAGRPATSPHRALDPDGDVYQMYTSGTTGRPKGAVITQAGVTANVDQTVGAFNSVLPPEPGQCWLIPTPLYHAAGAMPLFSATAQGCCTVLMADFVPAAVVRALSEERVAFVILVPAMIQACLVAVPDVAGRRYEDLRLITYAGSPIAEGTLRRAQEVFGCDFIQLYGMTEATGGVTVLMPDDHRRALKERPQLLLAAGRAVPDTEIRVVDEQDRPLPPGTTGEVVARGPQLMRGYWNLPEATGETLRDGWLHTGDAGSLDEEGYLYIQDRVKDMIVSGGENIYPREVEEVLFSHPAVADAAVIGVPDERWGETVKALVVPRDGQVATTEEITAFCRSRLGGYKIPRSVEFVEALPRNPSGKVLKRELREKYWAGHTRRVAGA